MSPRRWAGLLALLGLAYAAGLASGGPDSPPVSASGCMIGTRC